MSEILRCKGIVKNFGGVRALKGVDFTLKHKDALALIGENGAGKSTLMKIISGVYPAGQFGGEIFVEGNSRSFSGTSDAEDAGIAIIHQELNLFKDLSVAENIFLSHLPKKSGKIDYQTMFSKTKEILDRLGLNFHPETLVGELNTGNQQMVEIAKAMSRNCKILILDEPTSSLTEKEVKYLFEVLNDLRQKGLSFIYISHKLDEVFELCENVTVLRDGESVHSCSLEGLSEKQIVAHMVGRELSDLYPPLKTDVKDETPYFEVKNWSAYKYSEKKYRVKDFNFCAYKGEILGISGLMGAGRTDLLLSLFGFSNYKSSGEIYIDGKQIINKNPKEAIDNGLALVSEDRKGNGLHLEFSIEENISMASLSNYLNGALLSDLKMRENSKKMVEDLLIKIPSLDHAVKTLSGGNQQKVAIAKWLSTAPKVLFLDEPTRGIDVGAKFEIYSLLGKLVDQGVCVIIASSELPELMGVCNRIIVMKEGELTGEFRGDARTDTDIISAAVGVNA